MEQAVRDTLEGVISLSLYPRSEIQVNVSVLQVDGSLVCAIINACCLALMDAGIDMVEMPLACSVGMVKNRLCVDVNHAEQGAGVAFLPVAVKSTSEDVLFMQLDSRLSGDHLEQALRAALDGCRAVRKYITAAITAAMQERDEQEM